MFAPRICNFIIPRSNLYHADPAMSAGGSDTQAVLTAPPINGRLKLRKAEVDGGV